MNRDEVIGRHVADVIENTRLHIIAKTGKEERGYIQRIRGHEPIVHRIPIFKNQRADGAIGMLVFQDVLELNRILDNLTVQQNEQGTGCGARSNERPCFSKSIRKITHHSRDKTPSYTSGSGQRQRFYFKRKWDGKGSFRASHSRHESSRRWEVCDSKLLRHTVITHGIRIIWL